MKVAYPIAMITDVIQGSLDELYALAERAEWVLCASPVLRFYREILIAFCSGDRSGLEVCLSLYSCGWNKEPLMKLAKLLGEIRLAVLDRIPAEEASLQAIQLAESCPPAWRGETQMVVGGLSYDLGRYSEALAHFQRAEAEFFEAGAERKALKARASLLECKRRVEASAA